MSNQLIGPNQSNQADQMVEYAPSFTLAKVHPSNVNHFIAINRILHYAGLMRADFDRSPFKQTEETWYAFAYANHWVAGIPVGIFICMPALVNECSFGMFCRHCNRPDGLMAIGYYPPPFCKHSHRNIYDITVNCNVNVNVEKKQPDVRVEEVIEA